MQSKERRPEDWSLSERLQAIIDTGQLDENALNSWCRQQGLYPHHVKQWKEDFVTATPMYKASSNSTHKSLMKENKQLKQELKRKESALAETAALLVLKKKAQQLLGDEDN